MINVVYIDPTETANSKSHLFMFVVQNKMVPTPEGSFCMLVILTASVLDRMGIR